MTVTRDFSRPDQAVLDALWEHTAATLNAALGRNGSLGPAIRPLSPGMRVCGPAVTVALHGADNLLVHVALALSQPEDVLVVDARGIADAAAWDDVLTAAAQVRAIGGLVLDGAVRTASVIRAVGFPVFSRGTTPNAMPAVAPTGAVNVAVTCGGMSVCPGDIVVGDDDGVTVIPRTEAEAVLERARRWERVEEHYRRRVVEGATTIDLLNLSATLVKAGIEI